MSLTSQPEIVRYMKLRHEKSPFDGWRATIQYRRKANVKYERIFSTVMTTQKAAIEEGEFMKIVLECFGKSVWNQCRRPLEDAERRIAFSNRNQFKICATRKLAQTTEVDSLKLDWVTKDNIEVMSNRRIAHCLKKNHLWQTLKENDNVIYWFPPHSCDKCFEGINAVRYYVKYFDYIVPIPDSRRGPPHDPFINEFTIKLKAKYCGGRIMEPLELTVKRMKQVMSRNW